MSEISREDWDEILSAVNAIDQESDRCSQLVANLLKLSHRPPDGASVQGSRVRVNTLIADLLRVYRPQLAKEGVAVVVDRARPEVEVMADSTSLQQVLVNLLTNAKQAVGKGGRITISTRKVGDLAVVSVHDTGAGIPKEILPRIFDPFFTTKPPGKGTGLGLSVASSIVTQLGGTIRAVSDVRSGSRFEVRLPLAPPRGVTPGRAG
jgi:signal transduction histidine kinase